MSGVLCSRFHARRHPTQANPGDFVLWWSPDPSKIAEAVCRWYIAKSTLCQRRRVVMSREASLGARSNKAGLSGVR
jgi:hypothetical protein